jgi:hypothetical protein
MNCKQSRTLIRTLPPSEWLPQQRELVDEHARSCGDCALLLEAEQRLDAELHSLLEPEPSNTIVPVVMARIARMPLQHAPSPTRAVRVLSTTSRWIGVTFAIGAYLFALVQGESSTLTLSQLSTLLQGAWAPSLMTVPTIVFAVGILLFLIGLFAPLGRSSGKAHA